MVTRKVMTDSKSTIMEWEVHSFKKVALQHAKAQGATTSLL